MCLRVWESRANNRHRLLCCAPRAAVVTCRAPLSHAAAFKQWPIRERKLHAVRFLQSRPHGDDEHHEEARKTAVFTHDATAANADDDTCTARRALEEPPCE
jgi:hypothetical protein